MFINHTKNPTNKTGQLSRTDIISELQKEKGISIFSSIDVNRNIHAASFDITPTIVCMSVKTGMLQTVYVKKSPNINSYYVYVKPHDTLLIVSNEFVSLSNYISGYVTSRVSNVVNGFGHICTTIDPNWKGALLIGLSNPSSRTIKIDVGTSTRFLNDENMKFIFDKKPLATLTFHYLSEAITNEEKLHTSMRTDLLKKMCYTQRRGMKTFFNKIFYHNQKNFTDYFFEYLKFHENDMTTKQGWNHFLNEFSVFNNKDSSKKNSSYCKCATDFIIKETFLNRSRHFLENHKSKIVVILSMLLYLTYKLCLINYDEVSTLFEILNFV